MTWSSYYTTVYITYLISNCNINIPLNYSLGIVLFKVK